MATETAEELAEAIEALTEELKRYNDRKDRKALEDPSEE